MEVVAAVIERDDGAFLLAQRPEGKVYEGWWEFPGGKIEAGERPVNALGRELREELGITVDVAYPWVTRTFEYPHGRVRLRFFRVPRWHGELRGLERQQFRWQRLPDLDVAPILPANGPILSALALPLVMGVTPALATVSAPFLEALDAALSGALRLVQLRVPGMAPAVFESFHREVCERVLAHGARLVVNSACGGREEPAEGEGVHLTSAALAVAHERPAAGLVGASCHDARDLSRAEALGLDYAVLGPVQPTATHPGQRPMGWEKFAGLARERSIPVYAIGGLSVEDLPCARAAGAHGIAAIRSIWTES
ncbi:MAG: Nudix family hydrolase [Betaproteobacteria bacterium]|nr:Nudix family hydrolase [Betaproteobacteria bacterium]